MTEQGSRSGASTHSLEHADRAQFYDEMMHELTTLEDPLDSVDSRQAVLSNAGNHRVQ